MKLNATALLFAFVCIVQSSFLSSQPVPKSRPPEVDHVALHVYDLQRSAAFYEKVMTLERLPEPFKDGRHAWFRIGTNEQCISSEAHHMTQSAISTFISHSAFRRYRIC